VSLRKPQGIITLLPATGQQTAAVPLLGLGPGRITFSIDNFVYEKYFFVLGPFVKVFRLEF
jgi:hypothetical protein